MVIDPIPSGWDGGVRDSMYAISSGLRRLDPASAGFASRMTAQALAIGQYASNYSKQASFDTVTATALSSMSSTFGSIRMQIVSAGDGTKTSKDLQSLGASVNSAAEQMLSDANFKYAGQYLFSGTDKAFEASRDKDGNLTSVKFKGSDRDTGVGGNIERAINDSIAVRDALLSGNRPSTQQASNIATDSETMYSDLVSAATRQSTSEARAAECLQMTAVYNETLGNVAGTDVAYESMGLSLNSAKQSIQSSLQLRMRSVNARIVNLIA